MVVEDPAYFRGPFVGITDSAVFEIIQGTSHLRTEHKVEDGAEMYPGRLVRTGSTENQILVGDAIHPILGILGFEDCALTWRPELLADKYATGAFAPVHQGGSFVGKPHLLKGCSVKRDEWVANWTSGKVIGPVVGTLGNVLLGVPFVKSTTEKVLNIVLPAGMTVGSTPFVEITTEVAAATVSVGVEGTPTGFLNAVPASAKGTVIPTTIGAAPTLGSLLIEGTVGETTAAIAIRKEPGYAVDTAIALSYKTTNHPIAGTIWIPLKSAGIQPLGQAKLNTAAVSVDTEVLVFRQD